MYLLTSVYPDWDVLFGHAFKLLVLVCTKKWQLLVHRVMVNCTCKVSSTFQLQVGNLSNVGYKIITVLPLISTTLNSCYDYSYN